MSAQFLVRLDDACPTMNAARWARMEAVLDDLRVRPIVAVVPENLDPELRVDDPDPAFWEKVRSWREKGWTIAMHGYQHLFHHVQRKRLVLPFYDRSEFAGLSYEDQAKKVRASWNLFESQGVRPTAWVAPAHCFDRLTLRAIHEETPIRLVSDGIACDQYYEDHFHWFPQQLWSYVPRRSGLWTICLHPNGMTLEEIDKLHEVLSGVSSQGLLHSAGDIALRHRRRSLRDRAYATFFWQRSRAYAALAGVRAHFASGRGNDG